MSPGSFGDAPWPQQYRSWFRASYGSTAPVIMGALATHHEGGVERGGGKITKTRTRQSVELESEHRPANIPRRQQR